MHRNAVTAAFVLIIALGLTAQGADRAPGSRIAVATETTRAK